MSKVYTILDQSKVHFKTACEIRGLRTAGELISKLVFIFFVIIGFSSCKSVEYSTLGYNYYSKVILYKDGSFYKYFWSDMYSENHYYGNWKKKGDSIFLNIKEPKVFFIENTKVSVEELHKMNKDSLYFDIQIDDCSKGFSDVSLMELPNISIQSNENGFASIYKVPITRFRIGSLYCFAGIEYQIKDTTANYFKINMVAQFEYDFKNGNIYTNPTVKYIKKHTKLLPVKHDGVRPEFALKRKYFTKKPTVHSAN